MTITIGCMAGGRMRAGALLSPCGRHRYELTRDWGDSDWPLTIIMLNPSTADAIQDDPTIRRCISFARADGRSGIRVVNLFSYRATDPRALWAAPDAERHTVEGELYLRSVINESTAVLLAWGAHAERCRGWARTVKSWAIGTGQRFVGHLGLTSKGHPRHPLMVRSDQSIVWNEW